MSRPLGHLNNITVLSVIVERIFNIIFFITISHNGNFCNGLPRYIADVALVTNERFIKTKNKHCM